MIVVQVGLSQGAILLRDFPLGTSAAVMKLITETDRFRVENVFVFVTSLRLEREGTWELRKRICLL
jgi:hypothetical protein